VDSLATFAVLETARQFSAANEILALLEPKILEVETKLDSCEAKHQ